MGEYGSTQMLYGSPRALHERLLQFCLESGVEYDIGGETCTVFHTQYASYDLRDAVETVVEEVSTDPREDRDFGTKAREAVKKSRAYVDRDIQHFYHRREYVKPKNIASNTFDYWLKHQDDGEEVREEKRPFEPQATSRVEAIGEIFSLMLAEQAGVTATQPFSHTAFADDDDEDRPDEGVDEEVVQMALRQTALDIHGPSTFARPDPSMHVTQSMWEIYDEVGMNPDVREVYGLLVDPTPSGIYAPDDASFREVGRLMGDVFTNRNRSSKKWTSNNEPPLSTLDSYDG